MFIRRERAARFACLNCNRSSETLGIRYGRRIFVFVHRERERETGHVNSFDTLGRFHKINSLGEKSFLGDFPLIQRKKNPSRGMTRSQVERREDKKHGKERERERDVF